MSYRILISDIGGNEYYITYKCPKCGIVFDPSTWQKVTQEQNSIYAHCANPTCNYECEMYRRETKDGLSFLVPFPNCLEIHTVEAKEV